MKKTVVIIGLGYVGLPLAVALSKHFKVIGYDKNRQKIQKYKQGIDVTQEVGNEILKQSNLILTYDETKIKEGNYIIIAVPTPIDSNNQPNLSPIIDASKTVGENMRKGATVIYESTVYPGVTEEICIDILEKSSKMKCKEGFNVGYSPERINPGDKIHTLENTIKIVSGNDKVTCDDIADLYETVVKAGVYKVSSIKIAEAAKLIENSQRDINIAFINEIAMVLGEMGIPISEVIEAMNTKWNALRFYPGLVGGHCISVDPYYLIHKAEQLNHQLETMMLARKINDSMGRYITNVAIKKMIEANILVKEAKVFILGFAFKENCKDNRNTRVYQICDGLIEYGIDVKIIDPLIDILEVEENYRNKFINLEDVEDADCLIFAVSHDQFKNMKAVEVNNLLSKDRHNKKVIMDIKSIFNPSDFDKENIIYWNL